MGAFTFTFSLSLSKARPMQAEREISPGIDLRPSGQKVGCASRPPNSGKPHMHTHTVRHTHTQWHDTHTRRYRHSPTFSHIHTLSRSDRSLSLSLSLPPSLQGLTDARGESGRPRARNSPSLTLCGLPCAGRAIGIRRALAAHASGLTIVARRHCVCACVCVSDQIRRAVAHCAATP